MSFEWIGGDPALDFCNTVSTHPGADDEERLLGDADVRAWFRAAERLHGGPRLRAAAAPGVRDARRVRAVLAAVLTPAAAGRAPSRRALAALNGLLERVGQRVVARRGGLSWSWDGGRERLAPGLAWLVTRAAQLLTSDDRQALRRCASDTCSWLFLDRSRRHNRRWCDMQVCGSRAKARAYYRRRRRPRGG